MYQNQLTTFGLSDKESIIYLASLELGPSTIQEISEKCQISRSTTYEVIESLMEKRLMSSIVKGRKKFFHAAKPEKLMDLIDEKEHQMKTEKKELEKLLPELQELSKMAIGRPKIKFYEGKEGIRQIQEDILKTKNLKSIEEIIPLDKAHILFPPHERDHRHVMARKINVPERVIYTSRRGSLLPFKSGSIERRFIRFDEFPIHTEVTIFGGNVALVSFERKVTGIVIEAKDMAEVIRCMFNMLWRKL